MIVLQLCMNALAAISSVASGREAPRIAAVPRWFVDLAEVVVSTARSSPATTPEYADLAWKA